MIKTVPYHSMTSLSASNFATQFKYCCCCIPIRTGCFILGYINLIANLIYTIYFMVDKFHIAYEINEIEDYEQAGLAGDEEYQTRVNLFMNTYGKVILYSLIRLSWVTICICCLVGIHTKKPGAIRVYVGFAAARIMIQLFIFVHCLMYGQYPIENVIAECIEIGLAAYFIITYYIYVYQLERERSFNILPNEIVTNDIAYIYPSTIDKDLLVSKGNF